MSAFLCSAAHISAIVNAASQYTLNSVDFNGFRSKHEAAFQILASANAWSVDYRYNVIKSLPGYEAADWGIDERKPSGVVLLSSLFAARNDVRKDSASTGVIHSAPLTPAQKAAATRRRNAERRIVTVRDVMQKD
jgi:hypothetical protein